MTLTTTVVITSKNRQNDLLKAIESALAQTARPEVLVIDDGSTDGTSAAVRETFPQVTLHRSEQSRGYIVQRNRGAELATGDILFSIDDDAIFSSPRIVEQTLAEFSHPGIGAIAIPFCNVRKDQIIRQRAPDVPGVFATAMYIGTAHAVRRDVFQQVGGYRAMLVHQGEEGDFCLRMLSAGLAVALGRADPIHHFESPRRDSRRMDWYGRRNDLLTTWLNVPLPALPGRLASVSFNGLRHGIRVGRLWRAVQGEAFGLASIARHVLDRRPVSSATWSLFRKLSHQIVPLSNFESDPSGIINES